ncbi:unnamed protein product, partial [Onchocerca ochengi]
EEDVRQCAELFIDAKASAQLARSNIDGDPTRTTSSAQLDPGAIVQSLKCQAANDDDVPMETDRT